MEMPRENSELGHVLGRLLTAIQGEKMRAFTSHEWTATHAALDRAESLYWAAKRASLDDALGARDLRSYIGNDWLARHPRVLPVVQELEAHLRDFEAQA